MADEAAQSVAVSVGGAASETAETATANAAAEIATAAAITSQAADAAVTLAETQSAMVQAEAAQQVAETKGDVAWLEENVRMLLASSAAQQTELASLRTDFSTLIQTLDQLTRPASSAEVATAEAIAAAAEAETAEAVAQAAQQPPVPEENTQGEQRPKRRHSFL